MENNSEDQLGESAFDMNPEGFDFCRTMSCFFKPLTRHPIRMVLTSIVIAGVLCVHMGLAELVRQNSHDVQMLAAELLAESGPVYTEASKYHAEMLRRYVEHMEERNLARVLKALYPKLSPKKVLESALSDLEDAAHGGNQEKAREAIRQAGMLSNELYNRTKRVPKSPVVWFRSEKSPKELLADIDNALAESAYLLKKLKIDLRNALSDNFLDHVESKEVVKDARTLCEANRRGILLLFLARLSYCDKERIWQFRSIVEQSRDCKRALAAAMEDVAEAGHVIDWADSEQRRVRILEAMLTNDMDIVSELLREAIEKVEDFIGDFIGDVYRFPNISSEDKKQVAMKSH